MGEGVLGPYPHAKFTVIILKMWAAPKIAEIGHFWYKFAQKGYIP